MQTPPVAPGMITEEDNLLELTLRPDSLADYAGQENVKSTINIIIQAAQKRKESIDHLLIYGPPGLGKTTLAKIIGNELGSHVRITAGPAIERAGDLASILTNLKDGDILFIDEIHRLNRVVEETLYPAMEDHALDIIIGKGPSARTLRLDLPKFTIIGATTRIGLMSAPIRDRFGAHLRLDFYTSEILASIIIRSSQILNIPIQESAASAIAMRSRGTPRIANRILKRVRDFAEVHNHTEIDEHTVIEACDLLGIDTHGLDWLDRKYIECVTKTFDGGPVGIETIASSISEDLGTLEDVVEPYLLQKGLLKKTPRGRECTPEAYRMLGIEQKENRLL